MKVILRESVKTLGNVGEVVEVAPGYARNFLIPKRYAVVASDGAKKFVEDQRKRLEKKIQSHKNDAMELKKKVEGTSLELYKRVSGNGRLFGTVSTSELSQEFSKLGIELERRLIDVSKPIKQLGEFDVVAKLFAGVEATFKVKVSMDLKQAEEIRKKQLAGEKKKSQAAAKNEKENSESKESEESDGQESSQE